jgi:hypothetical protein
MRKSQDLSYVFAIDVKKIGQVDDAQGDLGSGFCAVGTSCNVRGRVCCIFLFYLRGNMKLWLLAPIDISSKNSLWEPWFDKCFGMVVRAKTEQAARALAQANAREEENAGPWGSEMGKRAWLDSEISTCEELTGKGEEDVILQDVHFA